MSERPKVLVREEIAEAGVDLLREKFDVDVDSDSDLASIIGAYDGIVIRSATKLTADLINAGTNLKVIGRAGVGVDNVDVDAATRRGIVVANAPESNIVSAAEHTIGLLFALARNIPQAHSALVDNRWERSKWGGVELAEKTLGVLGFGRIGQQVARRGLGMQMHVVAYDPFVSAERFREAGVEQDTLEGVLARADFVTLHLPLNDETRGVIGAAALAQMKHGARLINAARGELVDDERPDRRARVGAARRRSDRRLLEGALLGPAAQRPEHRRDAAPRRLDRRGAGPRRRDRRRAGRRRARRRSRHERGEHPVGRRRGPRGARPVPAARGERSAGSRSSSRAASRARSRSSTTASSPSTTRASSRSRR